MLLHINLSSCLYYYRLLLLAAPLIGPALLPAPGLLGNYNYAAHALIIHDPELDIDELEVGDVDDLSSDLPPRVRAELENLRASRELLAVGSTESNSGSSGGHQLGASSSSSVGGAESGGTTGRRGRRKKEKKTGRRKAAARQEQAILDSVRSGGNAIQTTMLFAVLKLQKARELEEKKGRGEVVTVREVVVACSGARPDSRTIFRRTEYG